MYKSAKTTVENRGQKIDKLPNRPLEDLETERINYALVSHLIHGTAIFTYRWFFLTANLGEYTIHGSYRHENLI